jgi:hypothetical protein
MILYRSRRAVQIEDENLRVTVLVEGGHIAEIFHKPSGVNPLWTPPWPSIEPSAYDPSDYPEYGSDSESKLLAGIMGHNLCLDIFGGPSEAEAAAGLTVHGEASVARYEILATEAGMVCRCELAEARLVFERRIALAAEGVVRIFERLENVAKHDHPVAWTQHVTLGTPFITPGATQFRASAKRSKVIESDFGGDKAYMKTAAEFDWPHAPHKNGGTVDMRTYTNLPVSAAYTAHLMDPARPDAYFHAWSPESKLLFGYVWRQFDFPWMGIWEENRSRTSPPWNGATITRGMEFGVSPMPETRRAMVERGSMFGVPGYRWIPASSAVEVEYRAYALSADAIPEEPPESVR